MFRSHKKIKLHWGKNTVKAASPRRCSCCRFSHGTDSFQKHCLTFVACLHSGGPVTTEEFGVKSLSALHCSFPVSCVHVRPWLYCKHYFLRHTRTPSSHNRDVPYMALGTPPRNFASSLLPSMATRALGQVNIKFGFIARPHMAKLPGLRHKFDIKASAWPTVRRRQQVPAGGVFLAPHFQTLTQCCLQRQGKL